MKTAIQMMAVGVIFLALAMVATTAIADPYPNQVLKFAQEPLIEEWFIEGWTQSGPDEWTALSRPYYGHDELSTVWLNNDTAQYEGVFMADDFADRLATPVVHVEWWGSYLDMQSGYNGVQNFLIAFETDVPSGPENELGFSYPGTVISSQVVSRYRGSDKYVPPGTFDEQYVDYSNLDEPVFHYNAELAVPFDQDPETVYWLKIVALNDEQEEGRIAWGWHNRNYLVENASAATGPPLPGEYIAGKIVEQDPWGGAFDAKDVWHFQDDAVTGQMKVYPDSATFELIPDQDAATFAKTYYSDADGPWWLYEPDHAYGDSPIPSKDLAFRLHTIPEPCGCLLLAMGLVCLLGWRRVRRG